MDDIDVRKTINRFFKEVRHDAKPEKCVICGKKQSSFCNSHSVPRMVLKNIAYDGKVLHPNSLVKMEYIDVESGVRNAGVFNYICNKCDNKLFKNYENYEFLSTGDVSDKILSEIALKNVLLVLSKRNEERIQFKKEGEVGVIKRADVQERVIDLDTRDYYEEMKSCLAIKEDSKDNFHILYKKELPYTVPMASQTMLALYNDLEGTTINDTNNLSKNNIIENLHVAVFPLEKQTLVLLYYHRKNRKYKKFRNQFNCLSEEKKLQLIFYWIVKYTEHYYFSPVIKDVVENCEKLSLLANEFEERPDLGFVKMIGDMECNKDYTPIKEDEIPNLLTEEYAINK